MKMCDAKTSVPGIFTACRKSASATVEFAIVDSKAKDKILNYKAEVCSDCLPLITGELHRKKIAHVVRFLEAADD